MQTPILSKIASRFEGKASVGSVDVDENPDLADRYSVRSIPTLILLKDGREIGRMIGVRDEAELSLRLSQALAQP
jgi:thioredoxin 1